MGTRTFRHLMAVCGLLCLTGCGTHRILSGQDIFNESQIVRDQYRGLIYVNGVELNYPTADILRNQSIITTLNDKGEITGSWIDYNESMKGPHSMFFMAHDSSALLLKVDILDRPRGSRELYPAEYVGINLPPGYLSAHLQSGINIELEGRRANQVIVFGPDYMTGYWQKVQLAQACVKAKTC
jgi:hypothetical protein